MAGGTLFAHSQGADNATVPARPMSRAGTVVPFSSFWIRFSDSANRGTSESSEAQVNETPKPTPGSDPVIEEPQQTPPHVPHLPPMRDPEPQQEQT
jgi:hypothetical protein